jgi:hypothetical protein
MSIQPFTLPEPAPPVALPMVVPPFTFLAYAEVNVLAPRFFVFFVVFPFFATMVFSLSGLIEPFACTAVCRVQVVQGPFHG